MCKWLHAALLYLFYAGSTVALSTVGMLIYCILPCYLFSNTICCSVDLCFIAFVIFSYDVATCPCTKANWSLKFYWKLCNFCEVLQSCQADSVLLPSNNSAAASTGVSTAPGMRNETGSTAHDISALAHWWAVLSSYHIMRMPHKDFFFKDVA